MDTSELFRNMFKIIIRSKKRGFQKNLCEKCGIDPRQLSDYLGGRKPLSEPKRISIVEELGYEYDEFLSMAKSGAQVDSEGNLIPLGTTQSIKRIYSRTSDRENVTGDMLEAFNNKKSARNCIDRLLEIDRIEPGKVERVEHYLCGFLEGLKPQKKTGT